MNWVARAFEIYSSNHFVLILLYQNDHLKKKRHLIHGTSVPSSPKHLDHRTAGTAFSLTSSLPALSTESFGLLCSLPLPSPLRIRGTWQSFLEILYLVLWQDEPYHSTLYATLDLLSLLSFLYLPQSP